MDMDIPIMNVQVRTLAKVAGVACPKETGKAEATPPCTECGNYRRCLEALYDVMGVRW